MSHGSKENRKVIVPSIKLIIFIYTTLHKIEAHLNLFKSGTEIMIKCE